ncbi:hypothetical protein [Nocardioides sp.]|uniref:hypothetical protein n=1 Tax=Nocardioides sp. TaxID=35761 RepID=UPI003516E8E8
MRAPTAATVLVSLVGSVLAITAHAASPAGAATVGFADADQDVLRFRDDALVEVEDLRLDIATVRVAHSVAALTLTTSFDRLDPDSWTSLTGLLDIDQDGREEYRLTAFAEGPTTLRPVADDGALGPPLSCPSARTTRRLGEGGVIVTSLPRTCLVFPRQVALHLDVVRDSVDGVTGSVESVVDSLPGFVDDRVRAFTRPVVVDSRSSAVEVTASATSQRFGRTPVTLTISSAVGAAGSITVRDGKKLLSRVSVASGVRAVYALPARLKVGRHRISVTFAPTDTVRFRPSSTQVTVQVRR